MASISGLCSSSSNLIPKPNLPSLPRIQSPWMISSPLRIEDNLKISFSGISSKSSHSLLTHSVARDAPSSLSKIAATGDGVPGKSVAKKGLETDPKVLWERYTEWLYQHKDLGLYLDVSRVGFTDEFVKEMEPRFMKAFQAMEDLEKGAIANPDEGRMVGHYWLRNPKLSPNSFLRLQIENTLEAISTFAEDIIVGKVSLFSLPIFNFFCLQHFKSLNIDEANPKLDRNMANRTLKLGSQILFS